MPHVWFEVVVPDDDEGESLGRFFAPAVPRIGERFCLVGHPVVCREDTDEFIAVVADVVWHTSQRCLDASWVTEAVVHLSEDYQAVTLYCQCTAEHLTSVAEGLTPDQNRARGGRRVRELRQDAEEGPVTTICMTPRVDR